MTTYIEDIIEEHAYFQECWEEAQRACDVNRAESICLYSEGVLTAAHFPYRFAIPIELEYEELQEEQRYRSLTPIGTRVLVRRRQKRHPEGMLMYDTVMERVDQAHRWDIIHAFYMKGEPSPAF
jgi:hypothetical protein